MNTILLGAITAIKDFPIKKEIMKESIKKRSSEFLLEKNLIAFSYGYEMFLEINKNK